jgi:arylsulfatase A-like enzyme
MPSSTYPNHATFVTGVTPERHGILANEIPTHRGVVPSWELGPSVPTLFDAMRAGHRSSAAVFGDHHLVGVTGAGAADSVWPGGDPDAAIARDILGYAKDRETAAVVVRAVADGAELVVAQFNEPDTVAHVFGPDSPEARHRYARADAYLGTIVESLGDEWDDWLAIVVSDHSQESVTETEPVDLRAAAGAAGLAGSVVDDGAVALLGGELAGEAGWVAEVPGVAGVQPLGAASLLAWSDPGRYFSAVEVPVRGVHGSPRTAAQIAVVLGGHPAAKRLASSLNRGRPVSTSWAPALAGHLGLDWPVVTGDAPTGR